MFETLQSCCTIEIILLLWHYFLMLKAVPTGEPDPQAVFCRRYFDEWPEYTSLAEIRAVMDRVEPALIGAVATQRAAMDRMVNSKNELPWRVFCDQHDINADRIHALAVSANPGLDGFEELTTDMYRAFVEPGESIRYDLRRIPDVEVRIVELLAKRCHLVRQAAFFKQDLGESSAPQRQARNIANARDIATRLMPQIPDLRPDFDVLIEGMYNWLVPMSVELQHSFWRQTRPQRSEIQARRITELMRGGEEIWNLGEFDNRILKAV